LRREKKSIEQDKNKHVLPKIRKFSCLLVGQEVALDNVLIYATRQVFIVQAALLGPTAKHKPQTIQHFSLVTIRF